MMPFRITKVFFVSAVLAVGAALAAYGILWVAFVRARGDSARDSAARTEEASADAAALSLQTLLAETTDKRARVDALFVGREGVVSFLKEIGAAAESAGVAASIVKVTADAPAEGAATKDAGGALSLALEAHGTFAGVSRFLALLERLPRPLALSRVSFGKDEQVGEWGGSFELSVLSLQ